MFKEQLLKAVTNTNEAYSEEGTYKAIIAIDLGTVLLLTFVDLTDGSEARTYQFDPFKIAPYYIRAYEKDGGDEEYDKLDNWMVDERFFRTHKVEGVTKLETVA